jgi:hypothetical protein
LAGRYIDNLTNVAAQAAAQALARVAFELENIEVHTGDKDAE